MLSIKIMGRAGKGWCFESGPRVCNGEAAGEKGVIERNGSRGPTAPLHHVRAPKGLSAWVLLTPCPQRCLSGADGQVERGLSRLRRLGFRFEIHSPC